jgi:hypothetical protein
MLRARGADYEKPHGFARFLAFIYRLIPKIGPFRTLSFFVPTPEAERLFLESFTTTKAHFGQSLDALRSAHLNLVNADFDTGQPTRRGEYSLADDTYDELLGKLDDRAFANVLGELAVKLDSLPAGKDAERKRSARVRQQLARLAAAKRPRARLQAAPRLDRFGVCNRGQGSRAVDPDRGAAGTDSLHTVLGSNDHTKERAV